MGQKLRNQSKDDYVKIADDDHSVPLRPLGICKPKSPGSWPVSILICAVVFDPPTLDAMTLPLKLYMVENSPS